MVDYYKILELEPDSSQSEIKKSYYRLANKYHPDKSDYHKASELFSRITEAYSVLSNPTKKMDYDRKRAKELMPVVYNNQSFRVPTKKDFNSQPAPKNVNKAKPGILEYSGIEKSVRIFVMLSIILSFTVLLDFLLPPAVESITVAEIINLDQSSIQLKTQDGETIHAKTRFGYRIESNSEIDIYHSRLFSRFFKIEIEEWPHILMVRNTIHVLMLSIAIVMMILSVTALFIIKKHKDQLSLGLLVIILTIGQVTLLLI